jgi:quercetin dioxygenase-like cupin family protein
MGNYHRWDEFPQKGVSYLAGRPDSENIKIRIMASERMMLTQVMVHGGGTVPRHYHEAEQILIIEKGKARVTTGKSKEIHDLVAGDMWIVPSNVIHGIEYIGDVQALEIVSPIRLDNFIGYVARHTFFEADDPKT